MYRYCGEIQSFEENSGFLISYRSGLRPFSRRVSAPRTSVWTELPKEHPTTRSTAAAAPCSDNTITRGRERGSDEQTIKRKDFESGMPFQKAA